ncbi:MAG TPA: WD40 repeat domain-containing protein [Phototrophicaceae bacterium]|nr:WD40 repeat domain-containing protein [Phototrophicaceae bacterium]
MKWLAITLVSFGFLFGPLPARGQSEPPYIYYYNETVNGFVIERADGTDSRLLGENLMPEGYSAIDDFAWSPSGKWVAWRGAKPGEGGPGSYCAWIMTADGSRRLTLLDEVEPVDILSWSPVDDFLLVVQRPRTNQVSKVQISIVDVETETTLAHTSYVPASYETITAEWSLDGVHVFVTWATSGTSIISTLSLNGEVQTHYFSTRPKAYQSFAGGRLLYYFPYLATLTMEDVVSLEQVIWENEQDWERDFRAYWNPQHTYALITEDLYDISSENLPLYLLDWERAEITLLDSEFQSVEAVHDYFDQFPVWSPDGRYAVFANEDERLVIFNPVTRQYHVIEEIPKVVEAHWLDDETALILISLDGEVYRYDLSDYKIEPLNVTIAPSLNLLNPSPDGSYAVEAEAVNFKPIALTNLKTGDILTWPLHSYTTFAGRLGAQYLWSEDSRWFLGGPITFFSGGGGGPYSIMVLNVDGTVRRELSVCHDVGTCTGFVPDRVISYLPPGQPQSVLPQPMQTLFHSGDVSGVAWSPDGKRVASFSRSATEEFALNIWDVQQPSPELLQSFTVSVSCEIFPGSCLLSWSDDGRKITLGDVATWDIDQGVIVPSSNVVSSEQLCREKMPDTQYRFCLSSADRQSFFYRG